MGMISQALSGGEDANVDQNSWNAIHSFDNLRTPTVADMSVQLKNLVQQGVLTPQQATAAQQQISAYNQIDPNAENAQKGALQNLQTTVDTRGMDPQSIEALRQLQQQTQGAERGSREAILQNAASRGIAGSGVELASQLGNQQRSATEEANRGFQTAADANQRYLQAIQGVGQLGGQITGEEQNKAAAQNAINQFNTANQQQTGMYNTQTANAAQAQNLAEKQRVADTNVATQNQQQLYNRGLLQQQYQDQLAKDQSISGANLGSSAAETAIAEHRTKASDKWSDRNLKKDIKEIDPQEFMDALTGYKYKFKDNSFGKGEHVGPMAQDVEKVAPEAIINKPEGKMIDYEKMGPPMLAALSSLHDRMKELENKKHG